jgi:5-methylcytosine-specific restriction endonuclease McrA
MSRTSLCIECGVPLIAGARGKLPVYCKACLYERRLAASRRWKDRNPEYIKTRRDAYYAAPTNREASREKSRRRSAAKPEEIRAYRRRLYLERQQATNTEAVRAWRAANPGKHAEINNRRRARQLDQFVAPVDTPAVRERDDGHCGICGEPVSVADQSLDHIVPIARGGTHEPANVQLAHRVCNSRKGARLLRANELL